VSGGIQSVSVEEHAGIETAAQIYSRCCWREIRPHPTTGLIISVTAIELDAENVVYRSGAKPNDLVVVTGDIGCCLHGITGS
jgi:thiamine-monophosphate kinase